MKKKIESILQVAHEIHKYADKFEILSDDIKEEIMILGDKVAYLSSEVLGLNNDESENLYSIYYDRYLIGDYIKFEEVVDTFIKERSGIE